MNPNEEDLVTSKFVNHSEKIMERYFEGTRFHLLTAEIIDEKKKRMGDSHFRDFGKYFL